MCYLYIYRKINNRVGICHKIDGKFYALNDTCGNMNALLSSDNIVNDNKDQRPYTDTFARNGITTKNLAKVFGTCRTTNGSY